MDYSIRLSDEDFALFKTIFFQRRKDCAICGGSEFMFGRELLHMLTGEVSPEGGPAVAPFAYVLCELCGHTSFFSAGKLGLVRQGQVLTRNDVEKD